MDKINSLRLKRLLKELDFVESDYEFRNEIIMSVDNEFSLAVNSLLSNYPELKEIYDNKLNNRIELNDEFNKIETVVREEIELDEENKEIELDEKESNNELKKIYRDIVKITHPDLVKVEKLNDLYIKATNFYDTRNKIGLYQICYDIGLKHDINESDIEIIKYNIESIKNRIGFLESTLSWKWYKSENENEKNKILLDYIKLRIN